MSWKQAIFTAAAAVVLGTGCGLDQPVMHVPADADAGGPDAVLLPDAVVVGEWGVPDGGPVQVQDSGGTSTPDEAVDVFSPGSLDTLAVVHADTSGLGHNDAALPGWKQPPTCEGGCPPGHACVFGEDGDPGCEFVAECSDHGVTDIGQAVMQILTKHHLYLKIKTQVWVGNPTCTLQECPKEKPCCNQCFAPLYAGADYFPIVLLGDGALFGCEGDECTFVDQCQPVIPWHEYLIWGDLDLLGLDVQLTVDGYCESE